MSGYAELQVTSNYSFLRGASHVEELFATAAMLGHEALAIVDRGSLAGIVRAWQAARTTAVRLVIGCRLDLDDGTPLLVYPTDRAAYSRLCRLLSVGKERAGKGGCTLGWEDLAEGGAGLLGVLLADEVPLAPLTPALPPERGGRRRTTSPSPLGGDGWGEGCHPSALSRLRDIFADRAYCALTPRRTQNEAARLAAIAEHARVARVPTVATGDVLYHAPERRILQDVLTCIREGCTIDAAGFRRERHVDRQLRAPDEMARLLSRHPDAIARTAEIAERCRFDLGELRYQYPHEAVIPGLTAQQALERLTGEGAAARYPDGVPDAVERQLRHELDLIDQLGYAPYFLTVRAIVAYARSQDILCQGRGSAANSAVCYVLGITSIDPVRSNLLFERFISAERHDPPDIDVDFEHERREEVIQWVYRTYGHHRAALCATVMRYRSRGAVRDVGKVLGLTEDVTGALASQVWGWSEEGVGEEHAAELNLNLEDRRLRMTLDLARELIGFPRHLGQHPGGFVLTEDRLDDLVPIEPASMTDRQVIEWDKDDIDALRFMKVDVLGLGMLGCMRRAFDLLAEHRGQSLDLASIPAEDPATYAMIRRADTLGTFQIESRAQMSMLPRMKPATFYDLVIEVAIVRPGPIQGDMVHPYLRRREGREPVDYPTPELEAVLGKTLGVPLFQEQAMKVAIVCAGFTPTEADQLRRAMATFKMTGGVSHFKDKLISGMAARGYDRAFAERTFSQIEGFGSYGFPESHAASFALIAYASSWLKCHHPDVFCCALLNAQPMGFYAPAQIVRDAREHGVEVRPVSINHSRWDCTLEPAEGRHLAVRLGLRMAKGLANEAGAAIVAARGVGAFASVEDAWRRADVPVAALEQIAAADGFATLALDRRQALWAVRGLADTALPLFAAAERAGDGLAFAEPEVALTPMTEGREVVEDYRHVGITLRRHPVAFLRDDLARDGAIPCAALADARAIRDGRRVTVAGLVLVRQKPGSAKGVMFITIEDESGHANLVVWPQTFERNRRLVLSAGMIAVTGRVQREGIVTHVVVERFADLTGALRSVGEREGFAFPRGRGDEATHGGAPDARTAKALGRTPRDIYCPEIPGGGAIRVPTRDFR